MVMNRGGGGTPFSDFLSGGASPSLPRMMGGGGGMVPPLPGGGGMMGGGAPPGGAGPLGAGSMPPAPNPSPSPDPLRDPQMAATLMPGLQAARMIIDAILGQMGANAAPSPSGMLGGAGGGMAPPLPGGFGAGPPPAPPLPPAMPTGVPRALGSAPKASRPGPPPLQQQGKQAPQPTLPKPPKTAGF